MKRLAVCVLLLMACGTNTGVQPLGNGVYKIFKKGSSGFVGSDKIRSDVELQASQYCGQQGRSMQVVNVITGQPPYIFGNFPKAEVQFRCVDPNSLQNAAEARTDMPDGEIEVASDVENADVVVDGKFVGNTPIAALKLAPGTHVFEVSSAGYGTWKREVTLGSGSRVRIVAELKRVAN